MFNDNTTRKKHRLKLILGLAALAVLMLSSGCIETVEEGHVGVQKQWGAATGKAADPGMQIDGPGVGYYDMDVRQKLYVMSSQSGEGENAMRDDSMEVIANDEMPMKVDGAVSWQIDRNKASWVYQNVGPMEAVEKRVRSKARECFRQAGSNYDGMAMAKGPARVKYKSDAEECMKPSLEKMGVTVLEVQIRNVEPPNSVKQAIAKKEAAKQQAEAKKYELQKEELEAERKRIEAQGIRDSQEIIDETLTEEYLRYLWIQEGIEKGDVIYMVPSDGSGQPVPTYSVEEDEKSDE